MILLIILTFASLAVMVEPRRLIQTDLNKYILQQNYTLQMNLLDYFFGDSLTFKVETKNNTKHIIDSQIIQTTEATIDFLGNNVTIIGFKSINNSVLLLTDGTASDNTNYYLYYFRESNSPAPTGQVKKEFVFTSKTYPKPSAPTKNNNLTDTQSFQFFSLEAVINSGDYYLDGIKFTGPTGQQIEEIVIIKNNIKTFEDKSVADVMYSRPTTDPSQTQIITRSIKIPIIMLLPQSIFRTTIFKNNTGLIEYLSFIDINNNSVDFKAVYEFKNNYQTLRGFEMYGRDFFIGFGSNVTRISLNDEYKKVKTKTFIVDNLIEMDLMLANNHIDLNYLSSSSNKEIRKVRWDNFDYPFSIDSQIFYEPITSMKIMNKVVLINSTMALSVTRGMDQFIFWRFPWDNDPITRCYTGSKDGITLVMLGKTKLSSHKLRRSAFLILNDTKNDVISVVATSTTPNAQPQTSTLTFSLITWNDENGKVLNSEDPEREKVYLSEFISSESLFNKNIPSSWFLGNFLDLKMSCQGFPEGAASINSYRYLGNKKLSFNAGALTSKNIFYSEFYSELSMGSFIFVFQLELKIYFQRCLLSQIGVLRCRTVKKIKNETDMIVEGSIFKGRYFMYLTSNGYFLHEVDRPALNPIVIMTSQGTCKYVAFLNFDMICCSNFRDKTLEFNILSEDGKLTKVFSKEGLYSTQIDCYYNSQFLFLSNEYTIDILALRTTDIIYRISSEITKRPDKMFKVCGNYLIVISHMMNSFEQYDISDVFNIIKIQTHVSLNDFGFKLIPSATVKFEKGCDQQWPLIVTDDQKVFAIFINIGGVNKDILDTKIEIGKYNYLANYYVSALSLLHSQTAPRVIWSFLDTSDSAKGTYFGFEIEMFKDYLSTVDLTKLEILKLNSNRISCKLDVGSLISNKIDFSLDFNLEVNPLINRPRIKDTNEIIKKEVFQLDMFESVSTIQVKTKFDGIPLGFSISNLDQDTISSSIKFKQKLTKDQDFSKLIRCSRINTKILDFTISKRTSFHILTTEAVYKIKNATSFFVQNYMMFTNMANDNVKINCRNMMLNEDSNLMINLCDQANVPFFLVSNWNSLKPGIVYQKQVEDFKDITKIRYNFNKGNDIYLFSYPERQQLKMITQYQKYTLRLNPFNKNIEISRKTLTSFDYDFQMLSKFESVSSSNPKETEQYFIGVIGNNRFVEDMQLVILKDVFKSINESNLAVVYKLNMSLILGPYKNFFSKIINMECTNFGNKESTPACGFVQERNMHYMLVFDVKSSADGTTQVKASLKYVFMNYANQIPSGSIDFDENYFAITSVRPSNVNTTKMTDSNLTKSYLLLYECGNQTLDPSSFNIDKNLVNITTGIPLTNVISSANETKLKLLQIKDIRYLFIISTSYYPFEAYRIEDTYQIDILKNVQSEYLNLTAINHYGIATIEFKIYDKFFRIIIIAAIIIGVLTLFIFVFTLIRNKDKKKSSTIMGLIGPDLDDSVMEINHMKDQGGSSGILSIVKHDLSEEVVKKDRFLMDRIPSLNNPNENSLDLIKDNQDEGINIISSDSDSEKENEEGKNRKSLKSSDSKGGTIKPNKKLSISIGRQESLRKSSTKRDISEILLLKKPLAGENNNHAERKIDVEEAAKEGIEEIESKKEESKKEPVVFNSMIVEDKNE